MARKRPLVTGLLALALLTGLAGCATMRPASRNAVTEPRMLGNIAVGDRVSVEMPDGSRHHFTVRRIEGNALISDLGKTYPWSDLAKIRRYSADVERKRWFVAGIVASLVVMMKVLESADFFGT